MSKILTIVIFLLTTTVFSQQLYHTKAIQFPSTDFTDKSIIRYDQNGNKYLAGTFNGTTNFSLQSATVNATAPYTELYIVKYNSSDSLLWVKQIKDQYEYGNSFLYPIDLEIATSGSVYLAYS
jgi:hypothetical protein